MYFKKTFLAIVALLLSTTLTAQHRHKKPPVINRAATPAVVATPVTPDIPDTTLAAAADSISEDEGDGIFIETDSARFYSLSWSESLKQRLSLIADAADGAYYNTGICVWDLTADSLLFGYNNNKVMRPASTQKVLTAVTALSVLGARHEFQTKAFYTGTISPDSILQGDVYVVGDMDPMYTVDDLRGLARAIQSLGIKRISGRLYGDSSMKEPELYGNGWCWDDVPSSNEPFLCALMLERGKESPSFKSYSKNPNFHPARDFVKTLSSELAKLGVKPNNSEMSMIDYDIKEMTAKGAKQFYTKSRTIEDVMRRMMKNSDNLHAESVFYQVANTVAAKRCTWKNGAARVNDILRKAGANPDRGEVADGSGVSLYNYVSPNSEVAMLRYAYHNPQVYPCLYESLPIAGVDGTLGSRMNSGAAYNNLRAKTGTVSGCSCLTGYVTAANGHKLAFSIMNNGVMKSATGRAFQDRVCQELAK